MVDPIHFKDPSAKAGFKRFDASSEPPETLPAPINVCISSIKRTACLSFSRSVRTDLRRFSKSPLYFVPAINTPTSNE